MIFLKRGQRILLIVSLLTAAGLFLISCGGYVAPPVNQPPVAVVTANPTSAETPPLTVQFDGSRSYDPDGSIVSYQWDFGDGTSGSGVTISHVYTKAGEFTATLTVTDNEGATGTASVVITIRCDILHEGDLVLRGNDALSVESQIYCQAGNIYVYDNAKLIIRNGRLVFEQAYHGEFRFYFYNNSSLVVNSGSVESGYAYGLHFHDQSTGQVENTKIPDAQFLLVNDASLSLFASEVLYIQLWDSANLQVESSSVNEINPWVRNNAIARIINLQPGYFADWNLHRDNVVQNWPLDITLIDSAVYHWGFGAVESGSLVFENCYIGLDVRDEAEIIVRDSKISAAGFIFKEGQTIVLNGLKADLTIIDSDLGYLWLAGLIIPETIVINSQIDSLVFAAHQGTVSFDNSVVSWRFFPPHDSVSKIKGTVNFGMDRITLEEGPWRNSTITREFPILVKDLLGSPLPGVNLELYSPQGALIWSGTSDSEGKAVFEIVFDDNNYDKTWLLKAPTLGIEKEVRFLTDTPIVIISS